MSKYLMESNSKHLYVEALPCNGAVSWGARNGGKKGRQSLKGR